MPELGTELVICRVPNLDQNLVASLLTNPGADPVIYLAADLLVNLAIGPVISPVINPVTDLVAN